MHGSHPADSTQTAVPLFRIREQGRYGFIDATGQTVIQPQYIEAEPFTGDFSRVRFNDKLVPLDRLGRLLLRHVFNFVGHFSEGRARVMLVQRWGYIDRVGRLAVDCVFDAAEDFREGIAVVANCGARSCDSCSCVLRTSFQATALALTSQAFPTSR